ncbi:efflux RND transporter permease subunit [Ruegeria lacuscaerulensis]|uniref:efflux RND transporter permease subunit n=1 Tax=Ruegeria lacuscaerulensis TaxID=55218 RepID=UPI001480AE65|nr:efflux RND transporter permease subunit [Ruegeria lacuscaerulensis]
MSLPQISIENRVVTYFTLFLILVIGTFSYFRLGQLEDPDFTVKTAIVITQYPGASPEEVELEVTDLIESAIQELPELRFLTSYSKAGLSIVKVEIKQEYWADRLPQVWDKMRSKVRDVHGQLPPGAMTPNVIDDFSFVYGFVLAITGDGFSYAQLEEYVKAIRKELALVQGVARVETWGVQPKVIYLDASEQKLLDLGVTTEDFVATLALQNQVVNAGQLELGDMRLRIAPTGEFKSPEDIGNLRVRTSLLDKALDIPADFADEATRPRDRSAETIAIKDVVDVRQGYLEPPINVMRFNGQSAIGISIANVTGGNIVDTGRNLDAALAIVEANLPLGIEMHKIAWQSDLVTEAINAFMINLGEAVLIVLVVVALAMGWRMGLVIGGALILTILGTFIVMSILQIDLQRVSLGALVIALGMMVDNAIVVADGMAVRLKKGMDRKAAAIEAAAQPSWALLGATVIAMMAFYPIFAATADAGEYAGSLFVVVGVSLLLSWLIAMTITPLMCVDLIKISEADRDSSRDPYAGVVFTMFRAVLSTCIRVRWLTVIVMLAVFGSALYGFQFVDRLFFTDATRQQFMVDIWAPEGTRIQQTSALAKRVEDHLEGDERVSGVSTFVGSGGPRFYLPVDPEFPYESYAQVIINTTDLDSVYSLVEELEPWVVDNLPEAMVRVRKFTAGPGFTWPFEARFSGPANADPEVLRDLARQGVEILQKSPYAKDIRTDMRNRVPKIVPEFDQVTGVWTATSRADIANASRAAFDGLPVGLYRQNEDLLPIIVRRVDDERQRTAEDFELLQVVPALSVKNLPLSAVTEDIKVELEDPIVVRWNRKRAVTIQASPDEVTFPTLFESVREEFEAIPLPPGYQLEWRGEYFGTVDSQTSLQPGAAPAIIIIVFLIVVLFNAIRPVFVIFSVVPLAIIGITVGLLTFLQPFSFMALLGAMSLIGLMIKNAIVLLDEINLNKSQGMEQYDSVMNAAVSRLSPVLLGAGTTILGVLPLMQDIFWVAMATTMAVGLAFGTVFTMIMIPVFYSIYYRVKEPAT